MNWIESFYIAHTVRTPSQTLLLIVVSYQSTAAHNLFACWPWKRDLFVVWLPRCNVVLQSHQSQTYRLTVRSVTTGLSNKRLLGCVNSVASSRNLVDVFWITLYILLTLILLFTCLPDSAWAAAKLAGLARNIVNLTEFSNQSKPNMVPVSQTWQYPFVLGTVFGIMRVRSTQPHREMCNRGPRW